METIARQHCGRCREHSRIEGQHDEASRHEVDLDDLVIVPIGIVIAVWMIPEPVMRDLRDLAQVHNRPVSGAGLVLVLIIWLLVGAMALRWLWSAL